MTKFHSGSDCWQSESPLPFVGLDAVTRLLSDAKAGGLRQALKTKERCSIDLNACKTVSGALINARQSM